MLISLCLFYVSHTFCQEITPLYNSVYGIHISLPVKKWDSSFWHPGYTRVYGIHPYHKKKNKRNDCGTYVTLETASDNGIISLYDRLYGQCADSSFPISQTSIIKQGDKIHDTIKSLVTCYICDNVHGRLKKADRQKVEFLFKKNERVFILTCNTKIKEFKKYENMFYSIARSVRFD